MSQSLKYKVINAVLFQIGWFSCILLSTQLALLVTLLILIIHFKIVKDFQKEFFLVFTVGVIGYCMDSFFALTGMIELNTTGNSLIYLVCIWLLFASTLNGSMKALVNRPLTAALLGILAPISYYAAQQFGKVNYSEPLAVSIMLHALLWGLFMLLVHKLYFDQNIQRINER